MKKKERLLIGKRIHNGEISIGQCMEQRGVSRETAYPVAEGIQGFRWAQEAQPIFKTPRGFGHR